MSHVAGVPHARTDPQPNWLTVRDRRPCLVTQQEALHDARMQDALDEWSEAAAHGWGAVEQLLDVYRPPQPRGGGRALDLLLVKRLRAELGALPPDERQPSRKLRKWIRDNNRLYRFANADTHKLDRYIEAANED